MDQVLVCVAEGPSSSCTSLSDAMFVSDQTELGPGAVFMEPIIPAENASMVRNLIVGCDCVLGCGVTRANSLTHHLRSPVLYQPV